MGSYRNAIIVLLGLLLVGSGCRQREAAGADPAYAEEVLSATATLAFLDSSRAAAAIIRDSTDRYFEKVRIPDIALQLGQPNHPVIDTLAFRRAYERSLATSVRSFDAAERALLTGYLREIYPVVTAQFPGIWPERIELIKITGTHFGPTAFYTREQGIYIPAEQFTGVPSDRLWKQVLLHEVFHLVSRRYRNVQAEWYALIGFSAPGYPIVLPDSLSENRLLNPDGIPEDWLIGLDSLLALPVIYRAERVAAGADFTDAMQQDYWVLTLRAGAYRFAPVQEEVTKLPAFRLQTGGNTDYLIHPDEILAENFLRLFPELTGLPVPERPEGRRVVEALRSKLRAVSSKR